jgi:epoxyqueuosine reductase QueG
MKRVTEADRGRGRIDLEGLLAADDSTLLAAYAHFYMPKRNPKYLRRNALIALGNSIAEMSNEEAGVTTDNTQSIGVLAGYLGHPDEVLRCHAAWALGRIGGTAGEALLEYQRDRERSGLVLGEIEKALATIRDAPR